MKTNYKIQGTPNSPVLVFSNSLGTDMEMWDELVPYLLPYFRVLQYDTRGHGGSEKPDGAYTFDEIGADLLELLDSLAIDKAYFCGLSMGGLLGQWLGVHQPNRFCKIAISNTAAKIGKEEDWNERIKFLQENGMQSRENATMKVWFSDDPMASQKIAESKAMYLRSDINGYCGCCAAIRDADFRESISKIKLPVLVIAGEFDPATTVEDAHYLVGNIKRASLAILPARHLSAFEFPEEFAKILIDYFIGDSVIDKGMHVRRTVLGNEHVDIASSKINDFNGDFQNFISHYAWGEIWTRPGLSKHNRSLVTLAMLIALNRPNEFKMHVKAAFNNGVTKEEIKEVIMQSALYCGLPAANDAIHLAEEVFGIMDFSNDE
jgi:3-oxoadipate enol-lactonase/4-carboxymuconolactone decarboxylase